MSGLVPLLLIDHCLCPDLEVVTLLGSWSDSKPTLNVRRDSEPSLFLAWQDVVIHSYRPIRRLQDPSSKPTHLHVVPSGPQIQFQHNEHKSGHSYPKIRTRTALDMDRQP